MLLQHVLFSLTLLLPVYPLRSIEDEEVGDKISELEEGLSKQQNPNHDFDTVKKHRMTKFEPGDPLVFDQVKSYISQMYPEGPKEEEKVKNILTNRSATFRAKKVPISWFPVSCKYLGIQTTFHSKLQDGERNLVLKLEDKNQEGKFYVFKRFNTIREYTLELSFFMIADHPNIVKPICTKEEKGKAGILMEYVEGKPALEYFKREREMDFKRFAAQIYDALKYIHYIGMAHGDFKPENIIVNTEGDPIIIDFGFVVSLDEEELAGGTPGTNSPEVVRLVEGSMKTNLDWWAFGATLAQIHGLRKMPRMLLKGPQDEEYKSVKWAPMRFHKVDGYVIGRVPHQFPLEFRQLLYYLMNPNWELRMFDTMRQLHWLEGLPFWVDVNFDELQERWLSTR